jgi:hypothetical protein
MKSFSWFCENYYEPDHPRVLKGYPTAGQWLKKPQFLALPPPRPSHPDLADVEGDDWNKLTALRLDREYVQAKPFLEELMEEGTGETVDMDGTIKIEPEEWQQLTQEQQDNTFQKWKENNTDDFYQSEVDNWHENGDALSDAMYQLSQEDLTETSPKTLDTFWRPNVVVVEWLDDALNEYRDSIEVNDGDNADKIIPFTNAQLAKALTIEFEEGYYPSKKGLSIDFDDDELDKNVTEYDPEKQMDLPGIEHLGARHRLTKEMRKEIIDVVTEAFKKKADDMEGDMDAPDYLSDSVSEYMDEYWDQIDDSKKFEYAKDYGEAEEVDLDSDTHDLKIPDQFDPLNENDDEDYRETQAWAKYLSLKRAMQIMKSRGIKASESNVAEYDSDLWRGWVGSSNSRAGRLLQIACAEELGARFNSNRIPEDAKKTLIDDINSKYSDYLKIGGFEGVKAIVRAKWETTQFLLEKAGINKIKAYRGIDYPYQKGEQISDVWVPPASTYKKSNVPLERNGCASFSLAPTVSNNWGPESTRLVIRAEAPRTALVSIPAYGQNEHHEREVVVAGTAWTRWDAWRKTAPTFKDVAFGVEGKSAEPKNGPPPDWKKIYIAVSEASAKYIALMKKNGFTDAEIHPVLLHNLWMIDPSLKNIIAQPNGIDLTKTVKVGDYLNAVDDEEAKAKFKAKSKPLYDWASYSYESKKSVFAAMLDVMKIPKDEITKLLSLDLTKYDNAVKIQHALSKATVANSTDEKLYPIGNTYLKSFGDFLNDVLADELKDPPGIKQLDKKETKNDSKAA